MVLKYLSDNNENQIAVRVRILEEKINDLAKEYNKMVYDRKNLEKLLEIRLMENHNLENCNLEDNADREIGN